MDVIPHVIQQQLAVQFRYSTHFTYQLFSPKNLLLVNLLKQLDPKTSHRLLFFVDEQVARFHSGLIESIQQYCQLYNEHMQMCGEMTIVPGGEQIKRCTSILNRVYDLVNLHKICRQSFIVAIGGGAVLDAIGYAAATAHRGVRLIRVPTTVLSQNDSGVGVKSGVNAFGKKNFVGAFYPPFWVLNDSHFLTTLDDRNWRSGIAEAIKVALIKDKKFFEQLEKDAVLLNQRNMQAMRTLIYQCAKLHMAHIRDSGDPFENTSSRPLDFGHWAAHKLESMLGDQLLHGEAVACGMALDVTYAYLKNYLDRKSWLRIISLLEILGFHLSFPCEYRELFAGLEEFREHLGGDFTLMMLNEIGRGKEIHEVDISLFEESIRLLETRKEEIALCS